MSVYDGLYYFSIVVVCVMTVVVCFTCVCFACSVCVPWSVCWVHAKRKVCLKRSSEQETTTSPVKVELVSKDMADVVALSWLQSVHTYDLALLLWVKCFRRWNWLVKIWLTSRCFDYWYWVCITPWGWLEFHFWWNPLAPSRMSARTVTEM